MSFSADFFLCITCFALTSVQVKLHYYLITVVEGQWSITVKTSDIENAGTLAKVSVTLYGDKSSSGLIELKNVDPQPFARGKESTFKARCICI